MPGVPSGRGCDGCRKQKKKCDQGSPSCSRCHRLNLVCVGAGVRRFKFMSHDQLQLAPSRKTTSPTLPEGSQYIDFTLIPGTGPDRLLGQFVYIMSTTTSLRYNFMYAYGGYLARIPQHLGVNEALDTSTEAVMSAYINFCRGRKRIAPETLMLYSRALNALRMCLNDPTKACAVETLCAIMLLIICQNFIGNHGNRWTSHCEGTAQILRARGTCPPRCEMEAELLLCLRGPVVLEALFNERIRMSPLEWESLIQNELDDGSLEGQMMHCLSFAPAFIQRGRNVLRKGHFDPTLQTEIDMQYQRMKEILVGMQARLTAVERPPVGKEINLIGETFLHPLYQRGYAIGMFVAIVLNCTLTSLSSSVHELDAESVGFAEEIVEIAHQAHAYRPLGGGYVLVSLLAGFAAATDATLRQQIISLIEDYHHDFQWSVNPKVFEDMKNVSGRLLICEPDPPFLPAMQTWEDLFTIGCSA